MREDRPTNPSPAASVLIVGLPRDVLQRVSTVLKPVGGQARMTLLTTLQEDAARLKPFAVFVDAYLYDFDPEAFDALAQNADTKLGVVNNASEAEELLKRMMSPPDLGERQQAPAPNAAPNRQELPTAKYDTKTIAEALERMEAKRHDRVTAEYDATTIQEAIKHMAKNDGTVTAEYDVTTLREVLKRMNDS
jgi:hypothetical protein